MADSEIPTNTPSTRRRVVTPSSVLQGNVSQTVTTQSETELNRERRINQMEVQLQEFRGVVQGLQQQRTQTSQVHHFVSILLPENRSLVELDGISHQKHKRKRNRKRKVRVGGVSQKTPWCACCRYGHLGPCTPQTRRCVRCGLIGHEAKDCRFLHSVCWNCHNEGHRSGDCSVARKTGSEVGAGVVGESSSAGQKRKNPLTVEDRMFGTTADDADNTEDVITGMF